MEITNRLVHRITIGNNMNPSIVIKLADDHGNGHEDFTINCTGKRGYEYLEEGHYRLFQRLHLCDSNGIPIHVVANGFYHLKTAPMNHTEYQRYYRITPAQYKALSVSVDELQFKHLLLSLGIIAQWKAEATKAIAKLEELTGLGFFSRATRSNFTEPTPEEAAEYARRIKTGYYTKKAIRMRQKATERARIKEAKAVILRDYKQAALKAKVDRTLRSLLLNRIGEDLYNKPLYYTHNNTLAFNWGGTTPIARAIYDGFISGLSEKDMKRLPAGIKIIFDSKS